MRAFILMVGARTADTLDLPEALDAQQCCDMMAALMAIVPTIATVEVGEVGRAEWRIERGADGDPVVTDAHDNCHGFAADPCEQCASDAATDAASDRADWRTV